MKGGRGPVFRLVYNAAACSFLAVCMLIFGGCSGEKNPDGGKGKHVTEVTILPVVARDRPVVFEYVAQVQSSHQVEIRARVEGFLDRQAYTDGTMVKEGQALFELDKKPFQARYDGAAAALSKQKAALETARSNLERVKPLVAQNALSPKDMDDAKGNYEMAAAAVEQSKTELAMAGLNLSYCTIVSPISGVAGAALQEEGAFISSANSSLTTVAVLSPMWVNFSLSENEIKRYQDEVKEGRLIRPKNHSYDVEIVLVNGSIFPHIGRLTFAAPSYSAQTGTFLIRASVDNPKGELRPNQFVRVRLKGAIRAKSITIPQRAIQQGAKGHYVWAVTKEGKAKLQPVTAGDWYGNDIFISDGLRTGDRVVVDGGLMLRPDEQVVAKPIGQETPPPAARVPSPAGTAKKTN